ncbi:elongator complex protein 3 [Clostridium oryzae]|uniref:Oxygen-independent coproporphyrinogen-III oxidase-like protein HemZ n=1 Tax=Clostridium oryzae TaxID=1450648 RepID=A0A1V4IPG9_9CLOT|nr:radical SAM protein [Clostridium oryzae]OPJ61779.1 oxygen-independent coproporphyrinogen-III oxidase-like protein HemZ [Clostridium oryzae]
MKERHYIIPIFVPHEGCPHNCVFCNQDTITGQKEVVDHDYAINIIESYLKTMDAENSVIEVSFFGGTFTAIKAQKQEELLEVAYNYKKEHRIDYIRLSTRPDYIDDEVLTRLKKYSVDIIELGVQSMDDKVLKLAGRGHTRKDTIEASKLIKQYGFMLGHQIMPGLPGADEASDLMTCSEIIKLKPSICRIYPALVLRNTPMEKMYRNGEYKPYTLDQALEVVKKIYLDLHKSNIKIIRVGLQTNDDIAPGKDIIAGPFHSAFRELIEGKLYCDKIANNAAFIKDNLEIRINPKDISKLYSNRKKFFVDMKKQLITSNLKITLDENVERGSIMLQYGDKSLNLSIFD